MKKILLLFAISIVLSCGSDDDQIEIISPEESYYIIEEGESKVEKFDIVFSGNLTVEYELYKANFDLDRLTGRKGNLIETKKIDVSGEYHIIKNDGFYIIDYTITNLKDTGKISIVLNENDYYINNIMIDELNLAWSFLIPYKYNESLLME